MTSKLGIGILIWGIGILPAQAQTEKTDTLRTKKEGEIYINPEAVKSIQFNFLPKEELMKAKPKMDETKPWMEFRKDLPANLTDTTSIRKKRYIRLLPYSIWGHDRAYLNLYKDSLVIRMKLNPEKIKPLPSMGHGYRVVDFSADKLLFENFTKRGRAIRRNKKKAKAWKIYKDYVPTKEDSLKWYGNKKRIPKDTLVIPVDSLDSHFINTK